MRTVLLCASLAALAASASAQCFDTVFGTSLGSGPDTVFAIQPIGFAFPLGGASYTDIHVTDKCFAYLSNAGVPAPGFADFTVTSAELVSGPPRVCPLWADIQCSAFNNNGEVFIKSTPTACTVTWVNAQCFGGTSGFFNVQMELSVSGTVKFLYGPGTTNNSAVGQPTWQVGLTGISPGMGATLPSGVDLSAGGAGPDNTLFELFPTPNTFDMADNGLLLVPTNPGWTYVPLGVPVNCASASTFGTGCVQNDDTLQEYMAWTAFDLANSTITFLRQPSGYTVMNVITGTFVTPSAAAVVVANADDIEQTVTLSSAIPIANGTTSSLTICSNGRIALSGSTANGAGWTPDVPTFLDFPETTIAADWHDYTPTLAGSGSITFEEVGGIAYVTWNNVYSFGTTDPSTFQYQFNLATGDCTIVYGAYSFLGFGNDHLVGYSVGGVSPSSLALDLSVALATPVTVSDTVSLGLALAPTNVPFLGNPAFTLLTSNVPPIVPLAFTLFGATAFNPGIDLTFIGMAGCFGYTSADLSTLSFPVASGTGSISFPIPNSAGLVGATLHCQSLAFSTATALQLVSSNGATFTIGN